MGFVIFCGFFIQSSELVEVLAKVLRSNCSIQELDLYECRLTKYDSLSDFYLVQFLMLAFSLEV